jgi:hypothetical protein
MADSQSEELDGHLCNKKQLLFVINYILLPSSQNCPLLPVTHWKQAPVVPLHLRFAQPSLQGRSQFLPCIEPLQSKKKIFFF